LVKRLVKHAVLGLAMVTSLVVATPVIASAKDAPTPMQQYRVALQAYNHQRATINKNFNAAIANDRAIEKSALASAKSAAQKFVARVDFNEARAADVANWETALKNLGTPPQPPTLPLHPTNATTTTEPTPTTH